ncbi:MULTISPECIES: hypothetical protein [unclassified Geodermatophilus]
MSAAVNSRAAVSFGSPQDVEVLVDGAWVAGAMLGWRHDETGACEVWVRLRTEVPGVVEGAGTWVDLAAVRLPERRLTLAPAVATAVAATAAMSVVRPVGVPAADRPRRSRRHCADVTAEQPAVGVAGPGRHRAPSAAGAGRHRAVTAEMPAVAGSAGAPVAVSVGTSGATLVPDAEPDLLTRPIRLGDLVPNPRGRRPAVRPSV